MGDDHQREAVRRIYQIDWTPEPSIVRAYIDESACVDLPNSARAYQSFDSAMIATKLSDRWLVFSAATLNDCVGAYDIVAGGQDVHAHLHKVVVAPDLDVAVAYIISNYNRWRFK